MNRPRPVAPVLAVAVTGTILTKGLMNLNHCDGAFQRATARQNSIQSHRKISTGPGATAGLPFLNRPPAVDPAVAMRTQTSGARTTSDPGEWRASGQGKIALSVGLISATVAANGTINAGEAVHQDASATTRQPTIQEPTIRQPRNQPKGFPCDQTRKKQVTHHPDAAIQMQPAAAPTARLQQHPAGGAAPPPAAASNRWAALISEE